MAPFRSTLLTRRSGSSCFAPRAHWVPVSPKVLRHSDSALSRRTDNGHYVNLVGCSRTGLPLMSINGRSWGRVARAMSEDTTRRGGLWSGKVSGQGVVNDLAIRISSQVTRHYYSSTFKVNREAEMAEKQDCPTPARFLRTSLPFCCWTIHAKTKISRNGVRSSAHAICTK